MRCCHTRILPIAHRALASALADLLNGVEIRLQGGPDAGRRVLREFQPRSLHHDVAIGARQIALHFVAVLRQPLQLFLRVNRLEVGGQTPQAPSVAPVVRQKAIHRALKRLFEQRGVLWRPGGLNFVANVAHGGEMRAQAQHAR